jgi:prephenate dehydrogenase
VRVAFIGLGLIGGSVARALHAAPGGWTLSAWSPRGSGPTLASEAGVIDRAAGTIEEAIEEADLVVLAAPPTGCLGLLDALAGPLRASVPPGAVITDVASTKAAIVRRAADHGLPFVGGHPMAGRETGGFAAADAGLFRDRPWVLAPVADDPGALARVEEVVLACGATPVRMDATVHDDLVAAISHMPLVLSAALVEAVTGTTRSPHADWGSAAGLAAGGWASMTRLARGDAAMGAGIATTNAAAIAARLRDVRDVIDTWLAALEAPGGPDESAMRSRLEDVRARLGPGV